MHKLTKSPRSRDTMNDPDLPYFPRAKFFQQPVATAVTFYLCGEIKPAEDYVHHQIKSILDKILETEHEYNSLIDASRNGVDWENEIESRRLRIQSLKRSLLDLKHKTGE